MNRRRKFLLASVLALQNSSFIYPSCQKCFSRVILVSKRSNCPKCGCTGESGNANYRYKLSLKVAESNKLFVITVFGSCLDTFFGLTATGLHRYIQDPNKIPETLDNNTTQNLLTKAVETCFVGQSFIFGVTNFESHPGQGADASNFLQQCSDHKRKAKALVACQIVLPDPGVAGFTVIDYFCQLLQTFNFRKLQCDSHAPNNHLLSLDHSNSDLSSIYTSDSTSYFFKSCSKDTFSKFWQPSLEFTSIVSKLTDNDDFSASEQSKAFGTLQQNRNSISIAEATGSSSCHDPIQDSWSLVSYMDKKSTAEKLSKELGLQAKELSAVHNSHHEIGVNDSNLFSLEMREPLKSSNTKSFHSAVEIRNRSQHEPPCFQHHGIDTPTSLQKRSACCPPSLVRLEETASNSQDGDPQIWDDLPFSESLNKFLAVLESEIAITQADVSSRKHHVDNDIDTFHADHSRLSVIPQRTTGALHTPPVALRSSQAIVKANCSKDDFLFNCKVNLSPSVEKESQPDNKVEALSVNHNGRGMSEYFLPNPYLSALFSSSKDSETIVTLKKTIRISPPRDEILFRPSTSESDHFSLNNKYLNGCGEKSLSEMNEKLTTLCSRKYNDVSDLCKLENKQYYRWSKNQDDSFTICRKLTYPLETLCNSPNRSTNTLKEMPWGHINNNLTQSYSIGYEGSYDASADLFDDIAKEMDIATEITKKSQEILLQWGTSLAESHPSESDFSLRSLSEDFIQPSQKLSLQSISDSRHSRTCSPTPQFQSDSEYNVENSQDFVPCSQSTPISGFHQTRIHGINRAFKKPVFYSDLDANYEKIRIFPENDKQQASPSCPKNIKTPSQKIRSPIVSGISQPEVFNPSPFADCHETDSDEWVPPTTQKIFPSDMLGFQVIGLGKCLAAHHFPDQELPRKKLKHIRQGTNKGLIKKKLKNMLTAVVMKEKTPKYNCKSSGWISKCPDIQVLAAPQLHPILGPDSCLECCLPFSEKGPPSVCDTPSAWSPELFSQKVT
ncbi:DNA damage-induced apoptosis suppressor protein isoform X2 [Piliocolobus tephrosceles]|uniref:DNA damage-induced apoptosis suppressor protein n=3 Tax=Piliocolobus tephrosceles TaxID=591936 RepID=A0A8C9LXH7_9PRIM|nr:DNA damage-induced apoptosis suppressor protein isoform X2 [Piliocolobus tephrosceles]